MAVQDDVIQALTELIEASSLHGRAILIGGQAIRDWHALQHHMIGGAFDNLPTPRATTDIDVHLMIDHQDHELIVAAIQRFWEPAPEVPAHRVFRFRWMKGHSITLDLIGLDQPDARNRVECLIRIGPGTEIGAVRVLPPWIVKAHLHERAYTPAFARLGIRRLTRLGLVAAKLAAVNTCVESLIQSKGLSSGAPSWTNRLAKDLQDIELLLRARTWVDDLWEPHYDPHGNVITRRWTELVEAIVGLREKPHLMAAADYVSVRQLMALIPRRLA